MDESAREKARLTQEEGCRTSISFSCIFRRTLMGNVLKPPQASVCVGWSLLPPDACARPSSRACLGARPTTREKCGTLGTPAPSTQVVPGPYSGAWQVARIRAQGRMASNSWVAVARRTSSGCSTLGALGVCAHTFGHGCSLCSTTSHMARQTPWTTPNCSKACSSQQPNGEIEGDRYDPDDCFEGLEGCSMRQAASLAKSMGYQSASHASSIARVPASSPAGASATRWCPAPAATPSKVAHGDPAAVRRCLEFHACHGGRPMRPCRGSAGSRSRGTARSTCAR